MTIRELLTKVRDKLQDTDSTYWHDSELLDAVNECQRHINAERKESPSTLDLSLSSSTFRYTVEGVLRYVSVKDNDNNTRALYPDDESGESDSSGIIVEDNDTILVNNPEDGVVLTIKHIALPEDLNLNDVVRSGDENIYLYYTISKAYEKDNDMQNFTKKDQFLNMALQSLRQTKKSSSLNYIDRQNTVKGYFF